MIAGLSGLGGLSVAVPTAGALAQARRRIGVAPLRVLFELLRGPAAGLSVKGARWRGRLVCAIDGTILGCPDTPANLAIYHRGGSGNGGTGYPLVPVLALVACGTRTIIDAVFGTDRVGETRYAHRVTTRDDRAGRPQLRRTQCCLMSVMSGIWTRICCWRCCLTRALAAPGPAAFGHLGHGGHGPAHRVARRKPVLQVEARMLWPAAALGAWW
jgi:hypothetical protein